MRRLILTILMLFMCGSAWGATYKKTITLSGTGSAETNYILPLNIHYGSQQGDTTGNDVFLDGESNTNFSDIRFKDSSGTNIPYYIQNTGNYEIIPDNLKIGKYTAVTSNGTIIASNISGQTANKIYKSINNGTTYSAIYTGVGVTTLLYVDSQDWIYIADGYLVKRSKDAGENWTTIHDNTTYGIAIPFQLFSEDASHNIFMGRYTSGSIYNPAIYKIATDNTLTTVWDSNTATAWQANHAYSLNALVVPATPNGHFYICTTAGTSGASAPTWSTTNLSTTTDNGVVWTELYLQHIHTMGVDPYTGYIYAGVDSGGSKKILIRSTDSGVTWSVIRYDYDADFIGVIFGNGYRIFSSGAGGGTSGHAIVKTTDDSTFTVVAANNLAPQSMSRLGSAIYAAGSTYGDAVYPQLLRSTDNGGTWTTIVTYPKDTTPSFRGPNALIKSGTPIGATETVLPLGMNDTGYRNSRIYEGGTHYQAQVFIKIPSLPSGGGTIYITYGNHSLASASDSTIFSVVTPSNLLAQWKLDEGTGTTINDTSGNSKNGVLTAGSGSWNTSGGMRIGASWPYLLYPSQKSYNFSSSRVSITGSDTDAAFDLTSSYSVVAWIRSTSRADDKYIIAKGDSTHPYAFALTTRSTLGNLRFYYSDGATAKSINLSTSLATIGLYDGTWHQVGYVIDNSSPPKIAFIVDGQLSATQTLANNLVTASRVVMIGAASDTAGPFPGDIQHVQIFTKALSSLEIQQMYEGRPVAATEPAISATGAAKIFSGGGSSFSNLSDPWQW